VDAAFVLAVAAILAFAFTNGFHDAANAIATLVATRGARPGAAIALAAVCNLLGPLLLGAAVADTIAGIVELTAAQTVVVVGAALANGTTTSLSVPVWATLACAVALTLRTALGGWRIVKTRGSGQVGYDRARLQHMSGSHARPAGRAGWPAPGPRWAIGAPLGSPRRVGRFVTLRRSRDAAPVPVRLLGLDLGVTSEHAAVVLDSTGSACARRRARPTVDRLTALETSALAGAEPATRLVVVIEPTGPAWLPIAVFFGRRGHTVLRITSAKAAALRRFLARHAKSNGIDAETLARLPLVAPSGPTAVEFGNRARASLDRRVRAVQRLTAEIGRRKTRISALTQALVPTIATALSDDGLSQTDLAVLERYADPRALLAAGPARLTRLVVKDQPRAAGRRQGRGAAGGRRPSGRAVGRRWRHRDRRPDRRGHHRGAPGPRG
jgi:transposase